MSIRNATLGALALGLAVFASADAHALGSRVNSMGATLGYADGYLVFEDEVNVFFLPATLTKFGNRAYIDELSGAGSGFPNSRFGFHYSLSDYTVIAAFGSNVDGGIGLNLPWNRSGVGPGLMTSKAAVTGFAPAKSTTAAAAAGAAGSADLTADHKATIMFAHDIDGFRFGVGLGFYGDSLQIESPNAAITDKSVFVMNIDLGIGFDFMGENSVDFGLGIDFGTFDDVSPPQETVNFEPDTMFGISLHGRGIINFFQGTQLIPYGGFELAFEGLRDARQGAVATGNYRNIAFEVGIALKIEPFEKVWVYPVLGMRYDDWVVEDNTDVTVDDRRWTLPYYGFGLDARIWDWFALRMGARQYLLFDKVGQKIAGNEDDQRDSSVVTTFDVGFGLFFGKNDEWVIDAHLSPDFFLLGPNFISGATMSPAATDEFNNPTGVSPLGGMNFDVALKYAW
jgi:hypothetical protein